MKFTQRHLYTAIVICILTLFVYRKYSTYLYSNLIKLKTSWKTTELYNKGGWKPGSMHKPTCRLNFYIISCCGNKTRKLHFVFENKNLNRDVMVTFKNKIKGKNVTICGDSLQRQLHEWMAEVLEIGSFVYTQTITHKYGDSYTNEWRLLENNGMINLKHFKFYAFYGNCR